MPIPPILNLAATVSTPAGTAAWARARIPVATWTGR